MGKVTVPAREGACPDLRVRPLVSGSGADSGGAPPLPTGRSLGLLGRRSPAGGGAGGLAPGPARLQQYKQYLIDIILLSRAMDNGSVSTQYCTVRLLVLSIVYRHIVYFIICIFR